jgi:opacity protein-like surface antigen
MRKNKIAFALLLTTTICLAFASRSSAQSAPAFELGGNYSYVRTNAGPGDCGCINMQGGGGWASYNFTRSLGIVGEVAAQHASNIAPFSTDLTLTSFLAGVRYKPKPTRVFEPFLQVLLGGAHASGDMAPGTLGIPGSANAFALTAGGGLDIRLSEHFAVRAIQADYYYTRFANGVNDHQNNLRLGAGLIYRFGLK